MSVSRRRLLMAGALGLSWTPFGLASCGDGTVPVDMPTDGSGNTTSTTNTTTTNTTTTGGDGSGTTTPPGNTTAPPGGGTESGNTTGGGDTTPPGGNTTGPGAGTTTPPPGTTPPASGPRIRYDLRSGQGQAMLAIYARGVAAMMALPESDPRSWTFWWYTHFIRDDRSKSQELTRVFGAGSSPAKTLANKVWDTCQSHNGQDENFFLPWHRMFVLAFENVIRQVTGEGSFTLPYWSYTDAGNAALPSQFRQSGGQWASLYRPNRNSGINGGAAIQPPGVLSLDVLGSPTYAADGADQGFCANIDGGLHGAVHVGVGDAATGMGSVPWAASDPIFWVHHANIDRIWASWNRGGGVNPTDGTFVSKPFAFAAPSGGEVDYIVGNMLSTAAAGYAYDKLEGTAAVTEALIRSGPAPAPPLGGAATGGATPRMAMRSMRRATPGALTASAPSPTSAPSAQVSAVSRLQGVVATPSITHLAEGIRLGGGPVRVRLAQAATVAPAVARALPSTGLVLKSLRRAAPPMVGAAAPSVRAGSAPAAAPTAPAAAAAAPAQTLPTPGPGQRALLVLNGIDANQQPGVVFGVFLVAPNGQKTQVGVLNFFAAMGAMKGMAMGAPAAGARSRAVSFDITALAQRLAASGQLEAQPQLSFEPLGGRAVSAGSTPTVRSVSLAIQ